MDKTSTVIGTLRLRRFCQTTILPFEVSFRRSLVSSWRLTNEAELMQQITEIDHDAEERLKAAVSQTSALVALHDSSRKADGQRLSLRPEIKADYKMQLVAS